MATAAKKAIVSIGSLASNLQRSVKSISLIATSLQIGAEIEIDGVPHYSAVDVERIVQAFATMPPKFGADPVSTLAAGLR